MFSCKTAKIWKLQDSISFICNFLVFVVLLIFAGLSDVQGTTYEGCNQGLTTIPTDSIPLNTTNLQLCKNQLTSLQTMFFPYPFFSSLDLHDNLISNVDSQVFYNLTWLTFLDVSHNKISVLPPELFATAGPPFDMYYPLSIDFSHNELDTLDADLFKDGPIILRFRFDNNRISCLPPKVFDMVPTMEDVTLSNNKISVISPEMISAHQGSMMPIEIFLDGNRITYIHAQCMSLVEGAYLVDFSNNLISAIHPLAFADNNRKFVLLKNNRLTCLPDGVFGYRQHGVNLLHNNISTLQPEVFPNESHTM